MRRLLLIGALAALVTGCGSRRSLDPDVADAYVDAQAHALCLIETTAYPTQAEQEAAYKHALESSKLTADELEQARAAAAKDEELRQRVSDKVAADCA